MELLKNILLAWEYENAEHFADWLWSWCIDPVAVMPIAVLILLIVALNVDPAAVSGVFTMLIGLSPFAITVGFAIWFWVTWIHYIRFEFWFSQPMTLVRVTLPPEVEKTPMAMELFLTTMYNPGGEGTFIQRIWKGQTRPVWSLEIASDEGRINFYIHMRKSYKDVVEARLYGQYPEAQVETVDDYVAKVPFNLEDYDIAGTEFSKGGTPVSNIMTYINYGLDKNPDKPETQVDPITSITEFMGSIGAGEHVWFQIIMKARKGGWDDWYGFNRQTKDYENAAKEAINKIYEGAIKRAVGDHADDEKMAQMKTRGATILSQAERDRVDSIERNLNKNVFECGVRVMYLARKGNYNGINGGHVATFFQAFRQPEYASFAPNRGSSPLMFNYPWQDWNNIRRNKTKKIIFFRYKHRAYHYVPYDQVPVFMTTEELATLWHFPSSVVKTPALNRVPARVSEAPINLPTGS